MKKELVTLLLALTIIFPLTSASLQSNFNEIDEYITEYNSGELNAPQLIVYIDYTRNKMYEDLDRDHKRAFTETEIKSILTKTDKEDKRDYYKPEYEKKFKTEDFYIVFEAHSFFRRDREYYEEREEDTEKLYTLDYNLVALGISEEDELKDQISELATEIKDLIKTRDDTEYIALQEKFSKIKSKFWEIRSQNKCVKIMEDAGMTEKEKDYPTKERSFYLMIEEIKKKDCWNEGGNCEQICDEKKVCDEGYEVQCEIKDICEDECHEEEVCIEEGNGTVCENEEVCGEVCGPREVCEDNENCWTEQDCYEDCSEGEERCEEHVSGEVRIEGNCREDGSDLWVNSWSEDEEFNYFQGLNEGGEWNCENEIESLVVIRKVLQKDTNNEFAKWYFEEFLQEDYDRILNGGNGFKEVLWRIIRNEEEISDRIHCAETKEWPKGFKKIDITYKNNNTNVEVWEKFIPVEWDNMRHYTTLFKYSWMPDKELLKKLINYKMAETKTIGPSAKDIAEIKSDEGKMEIIKRLSEKYGGSLDVKLELTEEDENIVLRYLQINPEEIVKISEEIPEDIDISVKIDYDTLYNFINYMSYTMESDRIEGPRWIHIEEDGGPGKLFSVIGAVSKMWREGITIKPRYALLKMFFNAGDIVNLISGTEGPETNDKNEGVKMSGNAILTKE
ncbi:hypothetical protein K8R30_03960 [archaeon]|nr:hypothetical protein [archaeon]